MQTTPSTTPPQRKKGLQRTLLLVGCVGAGLFGLMTTSSAQVSIDVNNGDQTIFCEGLSGAEKAACEQKKQQQEAQNNRGNPVSQTSTTTGETRIFTGERVGFFGVDPRTATAGEYVNLLYRFAISAVGFFAVAAIIFAGFGYVLSAGREEQIRKSKDIATGAIAALVLALLSHLILSTIDPRLVQLTNDFGASQDFSIGSFTSNQYSEPVACTTDADCESVVLTMVYEECSGAAAGVDAGKQVEQKTVCGKKPGESTGVCAVPEGGVERVLSNFARNCNNQTYDSAGVNCAPGLVPRPVANNGAPLEGAVISDDLTAVGTDWNEFLSGYVNAGLPISTAGIVGDVNTESINLSSDTPGYVSYEDFKASGSVTGLLVENVVRDDQGRFFAGDVVENHTNPEGDEYVYHQCLPPTAAQREYGSLITVSDAGRASGTTCQVDADCRDISRQAYFCSAEPDVEDARVTASQVCENGSCKVKKGGYCGSEAAEVCGTSRISGRDANVSSNVLADNCQSGTVCLQTNNSYQVTPLGQTVPSPYICQTPGAQGVSGFAYKEVDREGEPQERAQGLLGSSCNVNQECKGFTQDLYVCDGTISEYDTGLNVAVTCDTDPSNAHERDGRPFAGVCAIQQGSTCKIGAKACGQRNVTEVSYEGACETGTSCQLSRAENDERPALFACQ